ncbi:uncharacterized protein MONOS_14543 [Monocercomonoides exilis]|uniref:uncharacterized protein n=1 Tax=Monocercomonoides exilis TaxID=2049356 RepID=UPI003559F19A|nr:hypothetical protein MONOS_14543 [Monocercomonoides exilis]|eukprot:MONOS_14543.1-p1 / transcript=MONOS_14543.1 / gene=MONOS_14543 / organism=Monocercomonoides_exilis_PA203 / gene_product=unspecified product / transcript_product=unspecified product / location=Mono_scaffold01021:9733-11858(-) / protein_length=610 / sequence_SO=supercontig / SO=protein_coding / is_pseudo=false
MPDTLEGKENTQIQYGHRTTEVKRGVAIGPLKESLPGRLVNKLNKWKKIGGDKLVSRDDKQLFIPLGGGIKGLSGETRARVGGEVVQPDIHGDKEERKVEKDPGLQSSRRGSSLSVLQLSKPSLRFRRDAIWSKRRAHSIHEDNEPGSVIYQRKVGCEASDISGRHTPHAPRQGCIEIDLTGDSPVPEESGVDTIGRENEVGTHKERGVSGMVVELREDGSEAPREEESAASGGRANLDSTSKEEKETEDEGFSSTPREAEFCETTTPTCQFVNEVYAIRVEAGNSPRGLEGNGNSQPNDAGRINTLEKDRTREQTKESEEKEQTSRTNNICVKAGLGCSVNNTGRKQRGEDSLPLKLDPPGECVSDKREGVQSSVEETREKGRVVATTEGRSYSSEDRQHPGHDNPDGSSPGRTEHRSGCTQPDGEKAGLCAKSGESRRDIANSRTENTRYNYKTDCAGALRKYLETILSEKEEREKHARRRDSARQPIPEKHWTGAEREDEESLEGTDDSDSAGLAGADLDPATAAWAFDKDPGDLSRVHDSGSEDENGRLEITPRRGNKRYAGEENIQGRDLFLTWGEYVGAKDIAAATLKNQKSERDTWRALRRF